MESRMADITRCIMVPPTANGSGCASSRLSTLESRVSGVSRRPSCAAKTAASSAGNPVPSHGWKKSRSAGGDGLRTSQPGGGGDGEQCQPRLRGTGRQRVREHAGGVAFDLRVPPQAKALFGVHPRRVLPVELQHILPSSPQARRATGRTERANDRQTGRCSMRRRAASDASKPTRPNQRARSRQSR
jgi:hypothetical protein